MKAKIRIALAIDPNGEWNVYGWSKGTDEEMMGNAVDCIESGEARYWIECEVDVPEVKTIQGAVTNENCEFEVLKFADKIIGDSFYIADGGHHVYLLKDGTIVSLIPNIAMGYWETRELAALFLDKWSAVNEH